MRNKNATRGEAQVLAKVLGVQCCLTCSQSLSCSARDMVERYLSECNTLEEFFQIGSACRVYRDRS